MPFLANEKVDIPYNDILTWAYNGPQYDQDKPLFIDAEDPTNSISAAQAKILIRKLVAGFRKTGLEKGDTVLIHSFNNIYYPIIVLGIIAFGGVYTGMNPGYTSHELKHAIQASNAKLLIAEPECLENLLGAAKDLSVPLSRILILDGMKLTSQAGHQSWTTLLAHGEQDWHTFISPQEPTETPAMLLFSSGTTGLPKPAILSHANLISQHHLFFEHKPRPYPLSRLIALPMFHAATAPSTHTSALRAGHVQYIMRRFDPTKYLANAEKFRITDLVLVPPMVTTIVFSTLPTPQKRQHLQHVKAALTGAAPLDPVMQARFQDLLPESAPFTQIWAMTETSCFASHFPYPENDSTGSVGRFLPNLDVKLVDDNGQDISGYGIRGELCVRGPTVIRGYIGRDRSLDFDDEGYFRTGDVLYVEEETGKWYIVDRKKELIKVRGFQVAPAELEGVLLEHPGVGDAAVVGVMRKEGDSELPRAYVVRKENAEGEALREGDVMRWLEDRLAKYKRLEGGVKFVDVIPKTASGKILKKILREQAKKELGAKL